MSLLLHSPKVGLVEMKARARELGPGPGLDLTEAAQSQPGLARKGGWRPLFRQIGRQLVDDGREDQSLELLDTHVPLP